MFHCSYLWEEVVIKLFLRVAKALSNRGYNISIIDYADGYLKSNIPKGVNLIVYSGQKVILKDYVLITPLSYLCSLNSLMALQGSSKALYWGIHTDCEASWLASCGEFI